MPRWRDLRLRTRLMLAFGGFSLLATSLFSLYGLAFAYTVEDEFFESMLKEESARQRAQYAQTGAWAAISDPSMQLYSRPEAFPEEVLAKYLAEPTRREFSGDAGRHFHLQSIQAETQDGRAVSAWLLAEVSQKLVFRGMRGIVFEILGYSALVLLSAALLLAWWLARSATQPLSKLASLMAQIEPDKLPLQLPNNLDRDEVGVLSRGLNDLVLRIRQFVAREQEFTRDASHELRTPLSVISCLAQQKCRWPRLA